MSSTIFTSHWGTPLFCKHQRTTSQGIPSYAFSRCTNAQYNFLLYLLHNLYCIYCSYACLLSSHTPSLYAPSALFLYRISTLHQITFLFVYLSLASSLPSSFVQFLKAFFFSLTVSCTFYSTFPLIHLLLILPTIWSVASFVTFSKIHLHPGFHLWYAPFFF